MRPKIAVFALVLSVHLAGLAAPRGAYAQTALNLSTDLVPLKIAAANMTPNQPGLDAGPLLLQGVFYARDHGIGSVIVNPGTYYFLSTLGQNVHVQLGNISNMTIDFKGSALIFSKPLFYALIVGPNATNVTLQNFTVDYQPLPFTQVRVVSVDVANSQIQYSVEPGWQNPSAFNGVQVPPGHPFSLEVFVFRNGRRAAGTRRMLSQLPMTGDRFPVMSFTAPATVSAVRPGDVIVLSMRGGSDAINTNHCINCTVRNVTVYSCGCGGAAVGTISAQGNVLERVYSIPKPGTDRLVSTLSAVAVGFAGPGNQIRLSRAIRTMDDGFWFYGQVVGTVQAQVSAKTLTVAATTAWSAFNFGDPVPNKMPVGFQRMSDGAILGEAVIESQTVPTTTPPFQANFTFDRDLPANLVGAVVYMKDANRNGANSVLERSTVQEQSNCCGGVYVTGLANSAVRRNYMRRTAFHAVFGIQGMTPGSPPVAPLVNLSVANNVIDGTNSTSDWWWFQMGAIQTQTLTTGFTVMTSSPFSNIAVTNNFIADAGRSAVWMGNTAGGSVTGNYILRPNARPDLANANPAKLADATVPLVVDTTSSGITTANNTVDTSSERMIVTDPLYRELAAYAPGSAIRLNAYALGSTASPAITLTDADGNVNPMPLQAASENAIDVQLPPAATLGGAYVTLTSAGKKYFATLFVDSQDNVPAVNGCTYDVSVSTAPLSYAATSLPMLVVTQAGCSYPVAASDPFATPGSPTTGTGVLPVIVAANLAAARSTTIEIAGQPIAIVQSAIPFDGPFTDPLLGGVPIRVVHVAELRARIDAQRIRFGLAPFPWTDPVLVARSSVVSATHLQELRAALNGAYAAAKSALPQFTDGVVAGVTPIRAAHIIELRSAVLALE